MSELKELQRLAVKHPDIVAAMAIRGPAIELFKWIKKRGATTSRDVSEKYGTSIQSAWSRLDKLYYRGYLKRTEVQQESGGFEYVYEVVDL